MFLKNIETGQKVVIIFLTSVLILLFILVYFGNSLITFPPEKRPENVPVNAKFSMGDWFELVDKIDAKTYHFRIYKRISGSLKLDGIFRVDSVGNCLSKLDTNNILNNLEYYDRKIFLTYPKKPRTLECFLNLIELIKSEDTTFKGSIKLEKKIITK
ncbi:MAG: hypothetical protein KDC42_03185 [Ignavibacteriae bacterium]|nr:hypothetical protein [Ignavibacteriota bacterium]